MTLSLARRLTFLAVTATAAVSCDDLSPLPYTPPPAPDATPGDAALDGAGIALCRECVMTGPCAGAYAVCAADTKCKTIIDCVIDTDCLRKLDPNNITQLPPCALDCLAKGGASSAQDPALTRAVGIFVCVNDPAQCFDPCMK